ncbi:MAG: 16S rRNA (adenine(1518)-N(6)/adenine(1519)-N(6))-dimethyltransferase RsmA [Dehalococcoidia bacterium]
MSPRRTHAKRRPSSAARRGSARPRRTPAATAATDLELPALLRRVGLAPRKALGQHFLVDEFVLADIADACGLEARSTVLEIGAGPGVLTEQLVTRAGHVVAVELDEELASFTRTRLEDAGGLCVVAADVLDFTPLELLEECEAAPPYVACGNLPYYITQPVVRRLIEAEAPPDRIVVMVQREVARRMVGGEGRESLLSMAVRCFGPAEIVLEVPPTAFFPPPKVHSAVVRIERAAEPPLDLEGEARERFFNLLRAGFSEPRKQLHNALTSALGIAATALDATLEAAEVDRSSRAQHLGLEDWRRLFDLVDARHPGVLDAG